MTTEHGPESAVPPSTAQTPVEVRRPMPTLQELAEINEMPDEQILRLPSYKRDALLLARTKRSETAAIDAVNAANAAGSKAEASTAATQALEKTVADHGQKLEALLRSATRGGGAMAVAMIVLKIIDLVMSR